MPPNPWVRLLRLPGGDRRLLLAATLLLPLIGLSLRLAGVRRTRDWMRRFTPVPGTRAPVPGEIEQVRAVARWVSVAARHMPYEVSCLRRSLCLWWLLARRGIGSRLAIGVSRPAGGFAAHAWVEWQGSVLNDDPGVRSQYLAIDWVSGEGAGPAQPC
jgi:hypothetical protein